jgi:Leucine-rich repeat (LRR) protein
MRILSYALIIILANLFAQVGHANHILQAGGLCSEHPTGIGTFEDADLEHAVRTALSVSAQEDLSCSLLAGLTKLSAGPPVPVFYVSGSPRWPDPAVSFESLAGIQNLTGLTSLQLHNRSITDISGLSGLTKLTFLSLHTNYIKDISALKELTNLTTLLIAENPISDISALSGLTKLVMLGMHSHLTFPRLAQGGPQVGSVTDISPLSGLTNLKNLIIHTHLISDIGPLKGLTNLTNLRINNNSITDISPLSNLKQLQYLDLSYNSVTDLSPLRELTQLRTVDLRHNPDLSNIQPLLDNPSLAVADTIEIRMTSVTCADAALLQAKGVTVPTERKPPAAFGGCNQ